MRASDQDTLDKSEKDKRRLVLIFSDQLAKAKKLEKMLQSFSYAVRLIADASMIASEIQENGPAAILVDFLDKDRVKQGLDTLKTLYEANALTCPAIFVDENDDIETRVTTVRSGCDAMLTRPVNPLDVVDLLDRFERHEGAQEFRVLLVEDSDILARLVSMTLESEGYKTCVVNDPKKILDPLMRFDPELILLDLNMPEINGYELAALIRQQIRFAGIPIVFLSAEQNPAKQREAMRHGGDDFVMKPVDTAHLLYTVGMRAKRFRELRRMIELDALTGLLNHTRTKERVAEMCRNSSCGEFSVAVLDIDHFKTVNDRYGHAVGDTVIKALSWLLRKRSRQNDIVGRIGGEEFAIVMPGTDLAQAETVMNRIRGEFSAVLHSAGPDTFRATLSAGVAHSGQSRVATSLMDSADKSLYLAKKAGRNCVIVHNPG